MFTRRTTRSMSIATPILSPKVILWLMFFIFSFFAYVQLPPTLQSQQRPALLFQSRLPEPTATKPDSWIIASQGGSRQSGTVKVILPPGFTNQSGANAFVNMLLGDSRLRKAANVLPGTEFTLGIWPANDQVQYQKPIEIRILINAAQVSLNDLQNLVLMMYNPTTDTWEEQPSQFSQATFELVAHVQTFMPVAKDFPDWGGRTFFCVANRSLRAEHSITGAVVNRNANLRAGPGTNYAIIGSAKRGQSLSLVEKTVDGLWYRLDSGAWIVAFVVSNAPVVPVATTTPPPPLPSPTPA